MGLVFDKQQRYEKKPHPDLCIVNTDTACIKMKEKNIDTRNKKLKKMIISKYDTNRPPY